MGNWKAPIVWPLSCGGELTFHLGFKFAMIALKAIILLVVIRRTCLFPMQRVTLLTKSRRDNLLQEIGTGLGFIQTVSQKVTLTTDGVFQNKDHESVSQRRRVCRRL